MDIVDEIASGMDEQSATQQVRVQEGVYLLELSLDWIVLRASENIHHLLGESHVTLIEEPLGRFVHAQALHDLRLAVNRLGRELVAWLVIFICLSQVLSELMTRLLRLFL